MQDYEDNNDIQENEDLDEANDENSAINSTVRNKAENAIKNSAKNVAATVKNVVSSGARRAIVSILTNPYFLIVLIVIIISVSAYFIIKDLFSNNSVTSTKDSIGEIAKSKDADSQTLSVVNTYENNRSLLTATIKDINSVYKNYIEELEKSDPAKALKDMEKIYGKDEVAIEEMKFEEKASEYSKKVEDRESSKSDTSGTNGNKQSSSKSATSSKINSASTTSEYPKDAVYVLPSQKRELYKHMLMTEKYNFNMINWKLYKAQGTGSSRTLPAEPSDDVEYTVEPALGLRFPKSKEKTADYFVQLVEPYLQSSLFPISMYSMSITSDGNSTKNEIDKNAEFAYSIISEAYSDITMNIYQIEHYTENWSHEEWNIANGTLNGTIECLRVPTNLFDICKENYNPTEEQVKKLYCNEQDCTHWEDMVRAGFLNSPDYKEYADKVKENNCYNYKESNILSRVSNNKLQANTELRGIMYSLGADPSQVNFQYRNCTVTGETQENKDSEAITKTGLKTEDVLISSSTTTDIEYKPYRVKSFDIVLEYEYEFEVYNTGMSPDSISSSSTDLPDERVSQNVIYSGYETEAPYVDCYDDDNICDGSFKTIVGSYTNKVNRIRVDTTKNWSDKLSATPDGVLHRKYHIDDVLKFIADKENKSVSQVKLSSEAKEYYNELDHNEKLNRIDFINAVPEIYNSYLEDLASFDKNIAVKQSVLSPTYEVLIKRFREIEKNQTLPYIYGQTLGLNLKYNFEEDRGSNCNSTGLTSSSKGGYIWPVPSNNLVSSLFGYTPIYGTNHEGIDIWANESGEDKSVDVVAAKDGTVYLAQDLGIPSNKMLGSGGYGNHIIIKHSDGKYTLYGHLQTGTLKVKDKQVVKAGQVIAKMGSSGNSSAWHLHFNISNEPYSSCEDPLLYFNVEPTSSKYPEYSKLNKNDVTDFNAYKFVSVKSSNGGPSTLDGFLFIGDSRVDGIEENLKALGNNITAIGIVSSKQSQWIDVVKNLSGTILGEKVTLPKDPTGISVAIGVNDIQNTSKMDQLLDELIKKYPEKKIYVNSVYSVGKNYSYGNASDMNSYIKNFNEHLRSKCNSNGNLIYIDITDGLLDASGYLKSEYSSDGLHLKDGDGEKTLVNNISNKIINGSSSGSSTNTETNPYSVASELRDINGVGSLVNTTQFNNFKEKYFDYIVKWADAYEIDPYVVLAIIAHESGCGLAADENYYDHRANERNSDVYGIAQLTVWNTSTKEFGSKYKDKNGNTIGTINLKNNFLGNAELQIRVACAMLKVDFFGTQDNAISGIYAYNCGGGYKWTKEQALSTPNPISHKIYVEQVVAYYDIENSGGYSGGIYCPPDDSDSSLSSETIELSGSYIGDGKETGNDQTNSGYFTNAGGIKYHTYNQSAYGTFWTNNGCGPTSCAIVLSGLTGEERNPTEMFNLTGYTSFEKDLIPLLSKYGIQTEQYFKGKSKNGNYYGNTINNTDKSFILKQLAKGYPIIIYIKPGGTYNGCHYNGHFMTLLGVKENGDVYVGDPGGWGRDGWISLDRLVDEAKVTVYLVCKP